MADHWRIPNEKLYLSPINHCVIDGLACRVAFDTERLQSRISCAFLRRLTKAGVISSQHASSVMVSISLRSEGHSFFTKILITGPSVPEIVIGQEDMARYNILLFTFRDVNGNEYANMGHGFIVQETDSAATQ